MRSIGFFALHTVVLPLGGLLSAQSPFLRGDVDGDGVLTLADAVILCDTLVARSSLACADAADFNDNGRVNLGDVGFLIEYLLRGEPSPRQPFPTAGDDPTEDGLGCGEIHSFPVEQGGKYVLSLQVVGTNIRLRFSIENSLPVVGGALSVALPEGWAADSRIVEVRPSLELSTYLKADYLIFGEVGKDRKLRVVWLPSIPASRPGVVAGASRQFFDLILCPSTTPPGDYAFGLEGRGEMVGEDGRRLSGQLEDSRVTIETSGAPCFDNLALRGRVRHYVWMEDAIAPAGENFRVPLYTMSNIAYTLCTYRFFWDPKAIRAVWVDKVRPETSLDATFRNFDEEFSGDYPAELFKVHLFPFFRISICDPCPPNNPADSPDDFALGRGTVRNYHLGAEIQRLFSADEEFHQFDYQFEARPKAQPGETWIEFFEDPSLGGVGHGDGEAENEIRIPGSDGSIYVTMARPQLPARVTVLPATRPDRVFLRGDANLDGSLNLADPVTVFNFLFLSTNTSVRCEDAADANDDGVLDIADGISVLGFLFLGTASPPTPYPVRGTDPTNDGLGCGT